MPRIDSEKFYTSAIDMHGITAKGVNWTSKETQEIRFDVILDMLPNKINSLVDAGCGFGDFYTYMNKKNRTPKSYIGIDSLIDMYSIASSNTAQEIIIADITKDKIPFAEYYVCSGAMNVLDKFETYLFMRNCFLACGTGFIFNILHGEDKSETYNYFSTCQIQNIAKELKVTHVQIKTDYLDNDITVGFFK